MSAGRGNVGKPWNRQQRAMAAKPTRKAIQHAIASQAPPGWIAPERERKRRGKIDEAVSLEKLGDERGED